MKKNKILKLLILIICIFVIVLLGYNQINKMIAKERVASFLDGYQQREQMIGEMLLGAGESDDMSFEGISACFAEQLEYNVLSCRKSRNTYEVKVEMTTIDFEQVFLDSYQKATEKHGEEKVAENIIKEMEQNIKATEFEKSKVCCNVIVRKIRNEFKIEMDSSFANALTGGMNQYLSSLQGGQ